MAGQRQIDIVATEQNVLADRGALQLKFTALFGDGDQSEIGGAAADVDYQDQVSHSHALAPIGVPLDPGIKGGLRLLEQQHVLIAGQFGRF